MGTLQQALENPTTGTQRNRPTATATTATKKDPMDVVRRVREQRARQQTAKASMAETEAAAAQREEVIENITAFLEADETLTVELSELNRTKGRHPRGSVQAEETRNLVDQKTDDQKVIRQELGAIKASNQSAYDEGTRRYNFRQEALEMAESNRQLIGSATVADIRSRLAGAVEAGFIVTSANKDEATVSFDRQSYGSAWPHDPSVSDVTASLRELIDDLSSRREEGDAVITAELHRGGFYISARRDPDGKGGQLPSELDLLRDEGVARKASEFLAGKGQRYVARTGRGFTVLENRNGKFVAVKTSDPRTGRALFTVPDRESGGRVARKSTPEIANSGTTVTATDVSGVWYDPLRLALEEDLRREAESAERREAADELRDISSLETPLSLGDIATGSTGTAPVSISYEDPESRRRNTVTFQVTGNGTTFSVTGTVPGTEETIKRVKRDPRTRKVVSSKPFLPEFVGKETPLGVLEKDPLWRLVRDLNRPYERDWRLTREAERLNAVPVTRENFEGLLDLEGQNGVYAVKATLRKNIAKPGQERHFVYNPVGYIMERNGSKVKIVWAVPGTSANYAEGMIGNEYEVADLPNRLRFVLGNVDWTFTKTNNRPHLQPVKRQEAETGADNTEE